MNLNFTRRKWKGKLLEPSLRRKGKGRAGRLSSPCSLKEEVNTGFFVWSEEREGAPVEFLYNFPDSRTVYCLQVSEKTAVPMPDVEPCLPHAELYEEDEDELRLPMMEERELNFIQDPFPIPLIESILGDLEPYGQ